jgi:hypothetical protein
MYFLPSFASLVGFSEFVAYPLGASPTCLTSDDINIITFKKNAKDFLRKVYEIIRKGAK